MRINLNCPFAEKDQAKALGARWDAEKRVWYIVDVEDLTPFMRWISNGPPAEKEGQRITLADYQAIRYGGKCLALSAKAAVAFGIPFPLESGWFKKYKSRSALVSALGKADEPRHHGGKGKRAKRAAQVANQPQAPKTTQGKMVPTCDCDVLPWEECEHTPAYLAFRDALMRDDLKESAKASSLH